jgi:hypothetical protein
VPLENSIFRIIHRTANDPHGAEGYFIHELYMRKDFTIRGWRAGVSVGAKDLEILKDHMIRVIDAFNYEPISYRDLVRGTEIPLVWKPRNPEAISGDTPKALPDESIGGLNDDTRDL